MQGRREAEDGACGDRHSEREEQYSPVDFNIKCKWKIDRWFQRQQHLDDPKRQQQTNSAAGKRKQNTFGEELPDQTQPVCAHRQANRDLFATISGAREHQAGEIGAGDEQHEPHGRHHHPREIHHCTTQVGKNETGRRNADGLSFVCVGIFFAELLAQQVERNFCLWRADAALESSDTEEIFRAP